MNFRIPKNQFTKENVKNFFKLLEDRGWTKRNAVYPHSIFYVNSALSESDIEKLIFPAKIDYDNQAHIRQLSDGVSALADYYDYNPEEFWNSIIGSVNGYDTISLIEREGENVAFVSACSMSRLIQGTLSTLDSALNAVEPGASKDGWFMSNALLGHTFIGSYGISVKIPLALQYSLPFDPENSKTSPIVPAERKALELMIQALHLLEASAMASTKNRDELTNLLEEYPLFTEAIYDLIEVSQDTTLTIDAIAAESLPFSDGIVPKVKMRPQMFSLMREIRQDIMPREKEQTYFTAKGFVSKLAVEDKATIAIEKAKKLTVGIRDEESGRNIIIKNVDPFNYLRALRAHRQGRAIIVSGLINERSQQWRMQDARFDFSNAERTKKKDVVTSSR